MLRMKDLRKCDNMRVVMEVEMAWFCDQIHLASILTALLLTSCVTLSRRHSHWALAFSDIKTDIVTSVSHNYSNN